MTYTATLSASFGSYAPTLANVRISVDGQTISSGITAIANSNGSGFEATVTTLTDGFRGPFTFYDSTDATKFAVGSVGPEYEHIDADISSRSSHDAASVRTEMDSNSTQLAAIVADTNELQTDDVPGLISGLNDLSTSDIDARLAAYDPPTKAELDSAVSPLSTFDHTTDFVKTLTTSVTGGGSPGGANLKLTRTTTFTETFSGSIPTNWAKMIFTVKTDALHTDAQALIQVAVTNPADAGNGLVVLNGSPGTLNQASLQVIQVGGTATVTISDDASVPLTALTGATYDVKMILDDSTSSVFATGSFAIDSTPTWEV